MHCCANGLCAITGMAVLSTVPAFTQALDLPEGPDGKGYYLNQVGSGPPQSISAEAAQGLTFYKANYTSLGARQLPFNIVGTDPSLGANTTTVPTILVPLKFIFPNTGQPTLDGTNVIARAQNSPIFLTTDYTTGGTDLGLTQYGDAIQRAEFWNLPGFSQDYHVLLGTPTIAATQTFLVPAGQGTAFRSRSGGLAGVLSESYFAAVLASLLPSYTANQLPMFTTDNVFLSPGGTLSGCCVLGYHASQGPPAATARTWIYAAYTEPGTFVGDAILDVQALSHEVAEWLNDPFVGAFAFGFINLIPPAILPGTGGSCIINFETGDPLESPPAVFIKTTNSTVYHLQDEVFLTWYLHTDPSFSVNNWYTFLNTFPSFSPLCGPG
jgi:hypothetical protein